MQWCGFNIDLKNMHSLLKRDKILQLLKDQEFIVYLYINLGGVGYDNSKQSTIPFDFALLHKELGINLNILSITKALRFPLQLKILHLSFCNVLFCNVTFKAKNFDFDDSSMEKITEAVSK